MAMNPRDELEEFQVRRTAAFRRNKDYFIARQAMRNFYSWPVRWPAYKEKVMLPLVRRSVLTHANFLMGRGFTTGIVPLGTGAGARGDAQRAEKGLFAIYDRCAGWRSIWRTAQIGSLLGTSGFKVYRKKVDGKDLAWFSPIQPEFLYATAAGDDYTDLSKVFYAYTIDIEEANRQYGRRDWKSEREVNKAMQGEWVNPDFIARMPNIVQDRRIPVLESWTDEDYMLWVGGEEIENGANTDGWNPFVVIPNIDSGEGPEGLSDIDALVAVGGQTGLNNHLNWLLSDNYYVMRRLADPTLVWEMPPSNYSDMVAQTVGGGGVLPSRLGGKLYYLTYPGMPADMSLLLDRLRAVGIDVTGLNEIAFSGQSQGSINTGPSQEIKFTNVLSTLAAKQKQWEVGIKQLNYRLLALGAQEGEIAVTDDPRAKSRSARSTVIKGSDIGDHRETKITWPGALPRDDMAAAQLEIQKNQAGIQSKYTTLENLGFDFPDDEIKLIEQEMANENLNAGDAANKTRAQAALMSAQAKQDQVAGAGQDQGEPPVPPDLNQLTDTPPGVGTLPSGQVVDDEGNPLDEISARLARFRAENLRNRPVNVNENTTEAA